jgi:uncharacterized protein YwgA
MGCGSSAGITGPRARHLLPCSHVTPRDWLLLFLAFEGAPRGLDPVRLQKGMFLFAQEADVPAGQKYDFRPYNYGPMSTDIYSDLDELVARGLVERVPVEGQSWSRYKPTETGVRLGSELLDNAKAKHDDAAHHLYETKRSVAAMTFNALLEDVYDRYPKYASESLFRPRA